MSHLSEASNGFLRHLCTFPLLSFIPQRAKSTVITSAHWSWNISHTLTIILGMWQTFSWCLCQRGAIAHTSQWCLMILAKKIRENDHKTRVPHAMVIHNQIAVNAISSCMLAHMILSVYNNIIWFPLPLLSTTNSFGRGFQSYISGWWIGKQTDHRHTHTGEQNIKQVERERQWRYLSWLIQLNWDTLSSIEAM